MDRQRPFTFIAGALAGVAAAFIFDPRPSARRRTTGRWLTGRARAAAGPARGAASKLARHVPGYEPAPPPDTNTFIKQRVESALGHFPELALNDVVLDAADGVVSVRGLVPDDEAAEAILQRVGEVEGVRAAISFMRTADGTPAGTYAGDVEVIATMPAVLKSNELRRRLMECWPSLTDDDIVASNGHIEPLVEAISRHSGQPAVEVRAALDEMLLAAT